MLTASDFNNTIDRYAEEILIPAGFKKSGTHYYKIENHQYYGLIKHTNRGSFEDYYLVYSHESAGEKYKMLLKKPSVMLKDYPVSFNINDLQIIYKINEKLIDSPYNFFSLSRIYRINKSCQEKESVWFKQMLLNVERDELLSTNFDYMADYIKNIFDIITNYGFRFLDECDFNLCYNSINKKFEEKRKKSQYFNFY